MNTERKEQKNKFFLPHGIFQTIFCVCFMYDKYVSLGKCGRFEGYVKYETASSKWYCIARLCFHIKLFVKNDED